MTTPAQILFVQALEMEPAEREAFLQKACGADAELHLEVQRLLVDAERADSFFGDQDGATLGAEEFQETYAEKEGDTVGPFKLRQQIGEGGFGSVWMAEQSVPISRMVALKVIKAGMDTKQVLARFEAERQALAMMDHPNIARVLDAGATATGRPWFAMELVKGIPVTDYCDQAGLGTKERLALFRDVCSAINHAHQKGIIHRDIKPSNVMVSLYADKPVVKVIDFGIAKATQGKLTDQTLFTRFEQFVGTPVYMSPEQAALSAVDIDTRSDIYALGILLYELLVGKPPFDSKSLVSAGYDEMRRIIREVEPPKPSSRLGTVVGEERTQLAKARHIEEGKLNKMVEPDLDWIVMKAIEKDRSRRYETANAFAQDIVRFLGDEAVTARPPSAGYQFKKFARRNKGAFLVAAAMVALLLAGIAATSWQAVRATDAAELAREEAGRANTEAERANTEAKRASRAEALAKQRLGESELAREEAMEISKFLTGMFQNARPGRGNAGPDLKVVDVLDQAAKSLETELADQPERRFKLQATIGDTYRALDLRDKAVPLLEAAHEYSETTHGPDHPQLLPLKHQLALTLGAVGRKEDALKMREEHAALTRRLYGPKSAATFGAMQSLLSAYGIRGHGEKAEALLREMTAMTEQALKESRRDRGPEDRETAHIMGRLSLCYKRLGRREEALALVEDRLSLVRKLYGPESIHALRGMQNVSSSYFRADRKEEALASREAALKGMRKVLGSDDMDTLGAMKSLSESYLDAGRHDEALPLLEERVETSRRLYGPEHSETRRSMGYLASAYKAAGRREEAAKLEASKAEDPRQASSTESRRDVLPELAKQSAANPGDKHLAIRVSALQAWYGMDAEQAETCRRMLAWAAGKEDVNTASGVPMLTCLRPIEDAGMRREALAIARKVASSQPGKPPSPWYQMTLGMAKYRNGMFKEAADSLRSVGEILSATPGIHEEEIIRGITDLYLAMSLFQQGQQDEARALFTAAGAKMKLLPADESNPLAQKGTDHDDLILWLAYKEAKVLLEKQE